MVIEWLRYEVAPAAKQKFIEANDQIWNESFKNYPSYLGKEIWVNPGLETEVIIVIYWQNKERWKAIPKAVLEENERKFAEAVGKDNYQMLESKEYQVKIFRQI